MYTLTMLLLHITICISSLIALFRLDRADTICVITWTNASGRALVLLQCICCNHLANKGNLNERIRELKLSTWKTTTFLLHIKASFLVCPTAACCSPGVLFNNISTQHNVICTFELESCIRLYYESFYPPLVNSHWCTPNTSNTRELLIKP